MPVLPDHESAARNYCSGHHGASACGASDIAADEMSRRSSQLSLTGHRWAVCRQSCSRFPEVIASFGAIGMPNMDYCDAGARDLQNC